MPTVLAVAAHPDDIEFMMAGTLLRLADAGCALHYMNLADGCCGSLCTGRDETIRTRLKEAREAAALLGAIHHRSLCHDLEIVYDKSALAKVSAVIRAVAPDILLVPSLEDYMEDHVVTARLAVTAAFSRNIPNWFTEPEVAPVAGNCAVYHAQPYGLRDALGRETVAAMYADIGGMLDKKRAVLACHRSQKEWLDRTQGVDAYLRYMEEMSAAAGRQSGLFAHAEGWTMHNRLGLVDGGADPLRSLLADYCAANPKWPNPSGLV